MPRDLFREPQSIPLYPLQTMDHSLQIMSTLNKRLALNNKRLTSKFLFVQCLLFQKQKGPLSVHKCLSPVDRKIERMHFLEGRLLKFLVLHSLICSFKGQLEVIIPKYTFLIILKLTICMCYIRKRE